MKISVFGLGYVGTVCAACLSERGHEVVGVDKSEVKVNCILSGRAPIIERDLDDLLKRSVNEGRLRATMDAADAVASSELSLICVGTPSRSNGALDLHAIQTVAGEIGNAIRATNRRHTVVVRSTVVPGTTRDFVAPRISEAAGDHDFALAFNPEFLREGSAVADFYSPAKTVVGAMDRETAATVMSLYDDLPGSKISTSLETAELVKYVDNAWHALKVAFGNEVGMVAKGLGIDSHEIIRIFCEDKRLNISPAYLRPGFAFGGSCLPKDLRALSYLARNLDLSLPVLSHIMESNRVVIERGADWILQQPGRRVAFLGISFKSGTDDVRESPFVELAERLIGKGREVRIFDPNVKLAQLIGTNKEYLMRVLPHIAELMVTEIMDAVAWAETIVVTSSDPVYKNGIAGARSDQTVLDFAGLEKGNLSGKSEGFLW